MNYKSSIDLLTKAKIPCRVKSLPSNRVVVELGLGYPIERAVKVWATIGDEAEVCAQLSSSNVLESTIICGGPKNR